MANREMWSDDYAAYHAKVVQACCELMGEHTREFWDKQCSFEEEFERGDNPEDVADEQRYSL